MQFVNMVVSILLSQYTIAHVHIVTCLLCMDLLVHMLYGTDCLNVKTDLSTFNTMKDSYFLSSCCASFVGGIARISI